MAIPIEKLRQDYTLDDYQVKGSRSKDVGVVGMIMIFDEKVEVNKKIVILDGSSILERSFTLVTDAKLIDLSLLDKREMFRINIVAPNDKLGIIIPPDLNVILWLDYGGRCETIYSKCTGWSYPSEPASNQYDFHIFKNVYQFMQYNEEKDWCPLVRHSWWYNMKEHFSYYIQRKLLNRRKAKRK